MAAKKPAPRSLIIDLPEELLLRVVKKAKAEGVTVRAWVNPRVETMLMEATK